MEVNEFIDVIESVYLEWGYLIVVISSFVESSPFGWLIPGGLLTALGGFFAYNSPLNVFLVFFSGWAGIFGVLLCAYYIGDKTGMRIAKKLGQEKNAKRADKLLHKHGAIIITTSLLANITRFWVAYVAGIHRFDLKKFSIYALSASFTWTALLVGVGYVAGASKEKLEASLAQIGILSWLLVFLAAGIITWKIKQEYEDLKD